MFYVQELQALGWPQWNHQAVEAVGESWSLYRHEAYVIPKFRSGKDRIANGDKYGVETGHRRLRCASAGIWPVWMVSRRATEGSVSASARVDRLRRPSVIAKRAQTAKPPGRPRTAVRKAEMNCSLRPSWSARTSAARRCPEPLAHVCTTD